MPNGLTYPHTGQRGRTAGDSHRRGPHSSCKVRATYDETSMQCCLARVVWAQKMLPDWAWSGHNRADARYWKLRLTSQHLLLKTQMPDACGWRNPCAGSTALVRVHAWNLRPSQARLQVLGWSACQAVIAAGMDSACAGQHGRHWLGSVPTSHVSTDHAKDSEKTHFGPPFAPCAFWPRRNALGLLPGSMWACCWPARAPRPPFCCTCSRRPAHSW